MTKFTTLFGLKGTANSNGSPYLRLPLFEKAKSRHGCFHDGTMRIMLFLIILFPALLCACTGAQERAGQNRMTAYVVEKTPSLASRFAPVFVVEKDRHAYNRIGKPTAVTDEAGAVKIVVDPDQAAVYAMQGSFQTDKGAYTNLIYRIHFEKTPFEFMPFQIGAGKNVGLIVVVTLNRQEKPVLYTTVHTCGCYLAFIPTSYLPDDAYPPQWNRGRQAVYSENLPGFLEYGQTALPDNQPVLLIRDASHRVKDMWLSNGEELVAGAIVTARLYPFDDLEQLPLENGQTTSFYEETGPRRGYVKGSHKIWERLLISWWAFDWRVGEDKKLGKSLNDGILFYTSLKPWAREESDMRDFAAFLGYWGWRL